MAVKERLIYFLESQKISKSEFGRTIGVSSAYVTSMRESISPEKIKSIALNYPNLNIQWLLTGEGDMLINASTIQADDNTATATNGSTAVAGNGNSVTSSADLSIALEEIAAQRRLTESALTLSTKLQDQASKNQQQIDRLLTIIEHLQK